MTSTKIKFHSIIFFFHCFNGLAQLKKSTISVDGGQVNKSGHTVIYSVGQKTVTGNPFLNNSLFIHGYLNPHLSKGFKNKSNLDIKVYPNPFRNYFIVEFPFPIGKTTASLFDINGVPIDIKIEEADSYSLRFSEMDHLPTATYLLKISHGEFNHYRHLILDR